MGSKRPRSSSSSSSHSSISPPPVSPSSKLYKVIPDELYTSRTCTLPPTCSNPYKPTRLSSAHDVEEHYAKYHTHVCEHGRCRSVFPDARFLEMHFAECHDPITALKKERGEKIFACYLATCSRLFMTPKGRRLHLIHSHGYPKQFFFAVTNKGIGGLLRKWGQGASLYRGDWKSRSQDHEMKSQTESGNESEVGSEMDIEDDNEGKVSGKQRPIHIPGSGNGGQDSVKEGAALLSTAQSPSSHLHADGNPESDALAYAMSSLTLVPDKIRFGRGGKKGGFVHSHSSKLAQRGRNVHPGTARENKDENVGHHKDFKGHGEKRSRQRKASEGTSSMSGNPDNTVSI